MRTTLYIDDHLLSAAKGYAQKHGKTLTALVQDALREILGRQRKGAKKKIIIKLTTSKGGSLLPGVDLNDSAGLLDIMEDLK